MEGHKTPENMTFAPPRDLRDRKKGYRSHRTARNQARQKLRALKLYESPPERKIEIFDDPYLLRRASSIA